MTGAKFGSPASRKPRLESTNERPFLHWEPWMPFEPSNCQVAPASVVCHIAVDSKLHCVAAAPPVLSQPSPSVTNEITGCENPPVLGGNGRCSQVAPRSVERYRYWLTTRAQTTLVEAALSCADAGNTIGWAGLTRTPAVDGDVGEGVATLTGV